MKSLTTSTRAFENIDKTFLVFSCLCPRLFLLHQSFREVSNEVKRVLMSDSLTMGLIRLFLFLHKSLLEVINEVKRVLMSVYLIWA